MATHKDIAAAFAANPQGKGKAGNVFYESGTVYSYGRHFPVAHVRGNRAFFNSDGYSNTTARHKAAIERALESRGFTLTYRNTAELVAIIAGRDPFAS